MVPSVLNTCAPYFLDTVTLLKRMQNTKELTVCVHLAFISALVKPYHACMLGQK